MFINKKLMDLGDIHQMTICALQQILVRVVYGVQLKPLLDLQLAAIKLATL